MKLFDFLCRLSKYFAAKQNIPCVLRNYALLPYDNIGNDIDLLFPEATNAIIEKALTEIPEVNVTGYCSRYYVLSLFLHGIEWGQNNSTIQIDIIKHLCWKGIPYINIKNVVKNSIYLSSDCNWICRPQPHYEAIISFFSSYLVGGWINDKYQKQVRRIFMEHQKEVFDALCEYLPESISHRMIRNVISDNRATLMADLRPLRYSLAWCAFKKNPVEAMVRVWRYYIAEISILLFPKKLRFDVCVLGPDGSGKTTLIKNITMRLRNAAKVIEYKHFRPRMRMKS